MSGDANANDKSSDKFTILLTLTPISGCNSKQVTVGPLLILTTFAPTPKLFNVASIFLALCFNVCSDSVSFVLLPLNKLKGGILYSTFFTSKLDIAMTKLLEPSWEFFIFSLLFSISSLGNKLKLSNNSSFSISSIFVSVLLLILSLWFKTIISLSSSLSTFSTISKTSLLGLIFFISLFSL